jgi:hypothetical protein
VSNIGFEPSQSISIKEVIAKFGQPSAVLVTGSGTPEENPRMNMILFYDAIRAQLALIEKEGSEYEPTESTEIKNIGYDDNDEYSAEKLKIRDHLQDWKGYIKYRESIR